MNPILGLVATSIGAVVLVVLAIVYRRAAARRELELAEAAIEAEYTALHEKR
jgi:multisubunit Na+/H+ antiporter MnhB subunit